MSIKMSEKEVAMRGTKIRVLLSPISRQPQGPASKTIPIRNDIVIGTFDHASSENDYRKWRFPTYVQSYRAMYFERWVQTSSIKTPFVLDRAYLNIYKIENATGNELEILCLHCDPNEPLDGKHSKYKRGPHIHLKQSPDPFPHSHIAIALLSLNDVVTSIKRLTESLEHGILMIKEQFLDPLNSNK